MAEANGRNRNALTRAVAAQIRAERAASGLTQREVMDASGIPKSTYLRMESGERVVDVAQLAAFCAAVNVPMALLMERAEERLAAALANPNSPQAIASSMDSQAARDAAERAIAESEERRKRDEGPDERPKEA